jgi:hypothetical protein
MGLWSDWYSKNAGKENYSVNAEFVLKKIDEGGEASLKMTLNDAAESSTLPTTNANTPAITLLQTVRNNLKWLFNNKANGSHTHDDRYYTESEVDTKLTGMIKNMFPVGSIYMSVNNTNPSTWISGTTWTSWGTGRVPVGVDTNQSEFNTVEKTGGAKTHTLTVDEIPGHAHALPSGAHWSVDWHSGRRVGDSSASYDGGTASVLATGGGQAHNNLQPYITCYMWKRIV